MDGDSDGTPGSDMHAKKWSEYSSHGKITSSDPMTLEEEIEARRAESERLAKAPSYNAFEICARNQRDDDEDLEAPVEEEDLGPNRDEGYYDEDG